VKILWSLFLGPSPQTTELNRNNQKVGITQLIPRAE
jgi:hypothetical protein